MMHVDALWRANRKCLINLIYTMRSFTEAEIRQKMKEQVGEDIGIDGLETIGEYLDELREFGTLRYSSGTYSVCS